MTDRFDACLSIVLQFEGGFSDNPHDHGGRTNHGITQRAYDAWCAPRGRSQADVLAITGPEVSAIYRVSYWDRCSCSELPEPLDLVVFDAAVNSGVTRSTRWLQAALAVETDGVLGPITLAAARQGDPRTTARECLRLREAFLLRIGVGDQARFLAGWMKRIKRLRSLAT